MQLQVNLERIRLVVERLGGDLRDDVVFTKKCSSQSCAAARHSEEQCFEDR
jgi:hypothetical protein